MLSKINGIFKRKYDCDEIIEGNIRLDKKGRRLYLDDKFVETTVKEFDLLLYMMENKGKVLSKDELFTKIWGFDSESELQTLTVHIKWLREKLERDSKNPVHIQTVWGVGYRFD